MAQTKPKKDKPREENPFVLGAEVLGGSIMHRRLGRIVRVTKTLVEVQWDGQGTRTEWFGRKGQPFHGRVSADGEAIIYTKDGRKAFDNVWGEPDELGLSIASESTKARIRDEQEKKAKRNQEQREAREQLEADPVYQARQADLKRYAEALAGFGANIENGWNDATNYRIELDGIRPERMEALVKAIADTLR